MIARLLLLLMPLGLVSCGSLGGPGSSSTKGVEILKFADHLRVRINGQLFTEYHFATNLPQPFFYPLLGPDGVAMTRHWPMKDAPGEEHDHPHHRSFWFTHGEVNGHDFWTEGRGKGRIVHAGFDQIKSGSKVGFFTSRNHWVAGDGRVVCTDERTLRVYTGRAGDSSRVVDLEVTLHASHGEVKLGDTKEGTMALRIAESMRLKPNPHNLDKPGGHIVNSEGLRDNDAWGKRAAWCDYHGPVGDKMVGIAIFDHPNNPRHPTWWMVRDYGLFAANPFGRHEFEKTGDPNIGDLVIPAGGKLSLRYRILLHEGDEKEGKVAERYREYTSSAAATTPDFRSN